MPPAPVVPILRWFKENSCKNNRYMEGRLLQGREVEIVPFGLMDLAGFSTKIKHLVNPLVKKKIGIMESFPIDTDEV